MSGLRSQVYGPPKYDYLPTRNTPTPGYDDSRNQSSTSLSPPRRPARGDSLLASKADDWSQDDLTWDVARGGVGHTYGPYAYEDVERRTSGGASKHRKSNSGSTSLASQLPGLDANAAQAAYLWSAKEEPDDALHRPDAVDQPFVLWSARGWCNMSMVVFLLVGLIVLFTGLPIIKHFQDLPPPTPGFNLGGINATGQVPDFPNMPSLIDADTPAAALSRVGTDGNTYDLVFSDEFNVDGRTFWPGDDPFWEAQDLHYWATGDLEWYSPDAAITQDGSLVLTLSEVQNHDLNFMSGMLTTWNKFCFTTGYVEVSVSLPGAGSVPGLWPGAWTMANLGRAGFGATTDGMWPYSYDSCDVGTFPGQIDKSGNPATSATTTKGGPLSSLPGQRLSACTCPGSEHPGPSVSTGRGVPEIDILEAQVNVSLFQGAVSQSYQVAPFSADLEFVNTPPAATVYDSSVSHYNSFLGTALQQSLSAVTLIDNADYNGSAYAPYAYEWWSDPSNRGDGYITWFSQGQKTWTVTSAAIGPDATSEVQQRLISEEPMYLILNLGLSPGFQGQDWKHLQFPARMYVDYVRVYQRAGVKNGVTCDPPSRPTADYITAHANAYTDANQTTWAMAGYDTPRNSKYDGC